MMTDYKEVRGKRGIGGKILVGVFWAFQVLMVAWLVNLVGATDETMQQAASDAEAAGVAVGAGLGFGVTLFVWVSGTVILGVILLLTRPAKTLKAVENAAILVAAGFGVMMLASGKAVAEDAPSFDIASYCAEIAEVSGGSYAIEKGCRQNEQRARSWAQREAISGQVDRYCREVARAIGGSYMIYQGCVENERRARDSMN